MHAFKDMILPVLVIPFFFAATSAKKIENKAYSPNKGAHAMRVTLKKAEFAQPKISAAQGKKIAQNNGCFSCHSTNGKKMAGPTWKDLYGRKTTFKDGSTLTADSAYIAQSILKPKAKIVKGYAPVMPAFSYLKKDQIASLIAYIKSISKNSKSSKK
jgi:cytochrome c551/c552